MKTLRLAKAQRTLNEVEILNRSRIWANRKFLFMEFLIGGTVCLLSIYAYYFYVTAAIYPNIILLMLITIFCSLPVSMLLEYYVKTVNRHKQIISEQEKKIEELCSKVFKADSSIFK